MLIGRNGRTFTHVNALLRRTNQAWMRQDCSDWNIPIGGISQWYKWAGLFQAYLSTRFTWSLEGCVGFFTDRLFLRELSFATKLNGIKLRSENCSITCKDLLLWCSIMSPSTVCTTGSWNSEMLRVKGLLNCKTADLTIIQWFCYLCVPRPWRIRILKRYKIIRARVPYDAKIDR